MDKPLSGIRPADAVSGGVEGVSDADLPLLAAEWLLEGWHSEPLIELAGMTRTEAHQDARRLLPLVLASLGFEIRGDSHSTDMGQYTRLIGWAVRAMDGPFVPYSAAQKVLEAVDDDPATFEGVPGLDALAKAVDEYPAAGAERRDDADERLRKVLESLANGLGVGT